MPYFSRGTMFEKTFWKYGVLLMICAALPIVSCQHHKNRATNTLTLNFQAGDLPSLHPQELMGHVRGVCVGKLLFECLTRLDEKDKIHLTGAETVDVSADRTCYTFTLRKNRWSDGTPVTAAHYANAWKAALAPNSASPRADLLYVIKNGEKAKRGKVPLDMIGVEAVNDQMLVVNLEYPSSSFLDLVAQPVCAPLKDPDLQQPTIFNGPFIVASWERNNLLRLKGNPHFWNRNRVSLSQIDIVMMSDTATAFEAYEKDQLDWIGSPLSPFTVEQIQLLEKTNEILTQPGGFFFWVYLNTKHPALASSSIRHALSLALDRKAITKSIRLYSWPLCRMFADSLLPIRMKTSSLLREDEEDAKLLFQNALQKMGLSEETFPPLTISYAQQGNHKQFAEYLQQTWKRVLGINVRLQQMEYNVLRANLANGQFDISPTCQGVSYNDPMEVLEWFEHLQPSNFSQWAHSGYQHLITLARREPDTQSRFLFLGQAEEILLQELPVIPICSDWLPFAHRPGLKNYAFDGGGAVDFSYANWGKESPN